MASIGHTIRAARQASGMSQATLAKRVGISKTAMNDLELSAARDPRWSLVVKCARVLHAPLEQWALATVAEAPPDSRPA